MATQSQPNILYVCVDKQKRGNEQFVPEHALGYLVAGESHFLTNGGTQVVEAGAIGLVKRNQLVKTIKVPPPGGGFKAINIILDQETLRRYSASHQLEASGPYIGDSLLDLHLDPFLKGYFDSLLPYFDHPEQLSPALTELKTKEAIELLLRFDFTLKDFLFDFSEPHKIDLEAFMIQNYSYNVPINQFARLTGRSLATFKRDFQRLFSTSPQRWLQQKRLEQAHFLIAERSQRPSAVYLEVGFENLSHFSAAFKQQFGYNPSSL
ncbi:helix-turn-helix domain-containing protein [Spirosoma sp. HMF4905]|uniref:Helix-turn-helix domain-containing protein n=1 Tax=Spirosoma arboris TaxID=2682092 RepID=A0A7K1SL64_9BACT|nr:AraC family transcriptional regulator [Spirosoma arboris]MVM34549.1 helix-turn-helix domain-containing protein [Spirosoma arboris]